MMQILKLWLKISALLAILGWITHAVNPDFAAWIDGLFYKTEVMDISQPPISENMNPVAPVATPEPASPASRYKLND